MTDELETPEGATPAEASPGGPAGPAGAGSDERADLLDLIDRLSGLLDGSDLLELEVEAGTTGLVLRRPAAFAPVVSPARGGDGTSAAMPASPPREGAVAERPAVKAPLTGIWYASPAPGSAPYLQVGGEVAVGQVIGLIEAMKLFNEIKSELAGRVVRILAEDGQLVKAKQALIEVEPL